MSAVPALAQRFGLLTGILGGTILAVLVILALVLGYHLRHRQQVFPGVHFAGIDLQGLRRAEVDLLMQARLAAYVDAPLTLSGLGRGWQPTAVQLGMHISTADMASDALAVGRSDGLFDRLLVPFQLRLRPATIPLRVSFEEDVLRGYVQTIAAEVDRAPVDADLTLQGDRVVSVAPTTGQQLEVAETIRRIQHIPPYPTVHQRVELAIVPVRPVLGDAELQAATELTSRILSGPLLLRHEARSWPIERERLMRWLGFQRADSSAQAALVPSLTKAKVAEFLATIAKQLDDPPQDARLVRESTASLRVLRPGKTGLAVDQDTALERILAAVLTEDQRDIVLPVRVVEPTFSGRDADALAFQDLLADGRSTFEGSPHERANNIQVAARSLNGVVIPSGRDFSFLREIGPITKEAGYLESLTIQGDATVPGIGGGVCQVSTTVFRAAFWAGLPIVERNQHSYRVGYYEQDGTQPGLDAAVYDPGVDLRFRNDTGHPILLQSSVDPVSGALVYRLYGTRTGRQVRLENIDIRNRQEPDEPLPDEPDASLPPGDRKQVEWAAEGMHVTITRSVVEGDNRITKDTFTSGFVPWREKWLIGAEPTPTPTVTPTGTPATATPSGQAAATATPPPPAPATVAPTPAG
ncbi:MAG: hypothetical protein CL878_04255 [Dehalococcoidia bacterium]|nr:hypothetical protein [Dehalococcoidia bacterium]